MIGDDQIEFLCRKRVKRLVLIGDRDEGITVREGLADEFPLIGAIGNSLECLAPLNQRVSPGFTRQHAWARPPWRTIAKTKGNGPGNPFLRGGASWVGYCPG